MNPLNAYLAQSVIEERYAQAENYRRAHPRRPAAAPALYDSVTIRRVTPDDWQAIERLAQLDGNPVPKGAALLAEVDDRVLVMRSLADGTTVADPFHPTAELVRLLEARARQLGGEAPSAVTRPFRRVAARVTAMARH
jgi:hypothetical protein